MNGWRELAVTGMAETIQLWMVGRLSIFLGRERRRVSG